jgi:hypothetical protein
LTACGAAIALAVAVLLDACKGDDKAAEIERAVGDHAEILCERLFSCCSEAELAELAFVDEKTPPTHDGCVDFHKKTAAGYAAITNDEEGAGRVAIHIDQSGGCADSTRSLSCADFHARILRIHLGDAFALCNSAIVEALVDNGGKCKLYLDCTSGYCELPPGRPGVDAGADVFGTCKPAPKTGEHCPSGECAAGLRCDPVKTTCAPLVAKDGACQADDECASGACRGGKCASPGKCGG